MAFFHPPNLAYRGTGLGLAISKNLIELLGGVFMWNQNPERDLPFVLTLRPLNGSEHQTIY